MRRLVGLVIFLAACSSHGPNLGGGDAGTGGGGSGDMALPPGATSERLISSDFMVAPGTEDYQCQRITMQKDVNIVRITPVSPLGVHHEVVAIDPSGQPDGVTLQSKDSKACPPIGTNWTTLFASGVNSNALQMPDKVALQVKAGQQIILNLHLFNATKDPIVSSAAIDVATVPDLTGYQLAANPFVGNINFTVPQGGGTIHGQCTVSNDTHLFAVFPHMHTTGTHIKITAGSTVVWDQDYDFTDQKIGFAPNWQAPQPIVDIAKGDSIGVDCTYGAAGAGKRFGESTTDEMCFGISFIYPAITTFMNAPICFF